VPGKGLALEVKERFVRATPLAREVTVHVIGALETEA